MPSSGRRLGTTHQCNLAKSSNSCLPKLPPQAGRIRRCMRNFHKSLMVSSENSSSKFFFRSQAALYQERKRHLRSSYFIIHPFSSLSIKREIIMCVVWMFAFFVDPFEIAFYDRTVYNIRTNLWVVIDLVVGFILIVNIGLYFITGILKVQTKEVILEPKRIAKHYLLTYFFFDLFGAVPLFYIGELLHVRGNQLYYLYAISSCLQMLEYVRIKTTLDYFRRITDMFGFEDSTYDVLRLVLLAFYFLHWWSCFIYIVPKLQYILSDHELSNGSWVVAANIQPSAKNATIAQKYVECVLHTFCHFFQAGTGMYTTYEPIEQVIFAAIIITGIFFWSYVVVIILQMVSSISSSESKYEELINQLNEYTRRKKLPLQIRDRLLLYYENRFQKHYFREQAILNTLSEHLRYEIFLHSCKGLVDKVAVFQNLSKTTVGSIVAYLKHEVFLPNDIIIKAGHPATCMYFILFGTVAYIMPSGKEFCHYEDGDHFGEIVFFVPSRGENYLANAIALEITEVFQLTKKDLERCMAQDDDIADRFEKVATYRLAQMDALSREEEEDEGKRRNLVLRELRKGRILEHDHRKRRH